jgi:Immunoglobulin I-set domain
MPRRRFDEPTPAYDSIIVHRASKNNLRFDSELKDQTVVEGNTVKLLCCVSGPNPNFKWQKNGKQVVWSDRVKNLTKDTFGGIKISKLTEADSGVYSCIIKNSYNELESVCNLVVYPAPPQGDQIPTFSRITGEGFFLTITQS